jgi:hypothetical protein
VQEDCGNTMGSTHKHKHKHRHKHHHHKSSQHGSHGSRSRSIMRVGAIGVVAGVGMLAVVAVVVFAIRSIGELIIFNKETAGEFWAAQQRDTARMGIWAAQSIISEPSTEEDETAIAIAPAMREMGLSGISGSMFYDNMQTSLAFVDKQFVDHVCRSVMKEQSIIEGIARLHELGTSTTIAEQQMHDLYSNASLYGEAAARSLVSPSSHLMVMVGEWVAVAAVAGVASRSVGGEQGENAVVAARVVTSALRETTLPAWYKGTKAHSTYLSLVKQSWWDVLTKNAVAGGIRAAHEFGVMGIDSSAVQREVQVGYVLVGFTLCVAAFWFYQVTAYPDDGDIKGRYEHFEYGVESRNERWRRYFEHTLIPNVIDDLDDDVDDVDGKVNHKREMTKMLAQLKFRTEDKPEIPGRNGKRDRFVKPVHLPAMEGGAAGTVIDRLRGKLREVSMKAAFVTMETKISRIEKDYGVDIAPLVDEIEIIADMVASEEGERPGSIIADMLDALENTRAPGERERDPGSFDPMDPKETDTFVYLDRFLSRESNIIVAESTSIGSFLGRVSS